MMTIDQFPDRILHVNHKKYLYFGGTSYLGLPTNAKFQKIVAKKIQQWGTSYGSSRSANVQLSAYATGEQTLAKWIQSEATVTVSSGMLAGKIVLEVLLQKGVKCYHFPNVHTALQTPKSRPIYVDGNLHPDLGTSKKETVVLVTDSYPTSHVQPIDLKVIENIGASKSIILVLDESHSLGITGPNGGGIYSTIQLANVQSKVMIASLGKALGVTGGIIAGEAALIQEIKNHPVFVSAAGMNPGFLSAVTDAIPLIQKKYRKLLDNLRYFKSIVPKEAALTFDENYPLLYPHEADFHESCLEDQIVIVNFPYNTPTGSLNRIVVTANHKKKDLKRLAAVFLKTKKTPE